jgi:hypothetical protein
MNAGIYAGFRYRFCTEVGKDMGRKIRELTVGTQLLGAVAAAQPDPDLPWKGHLDSDVRSLRSPA